MIYEEKVTLIIRKAIEENAIYFRNINESTTSFLNKSSDTLSSYLGLMATILVGLVPIFIDSLKPINDLQKVTVVIYISILSISIVFGLLNKILIVKFWQGERIYSSKLTSKWGEARNKMLTKFSKLRVIYDKTCAYQEGLIEKRKIKSAGWPLYWQILSLTIGGILGIIYLLGMLIR